jgi:hypothetical protein
MVRWRTKAPEFVFVVVVVIVTNKQRLRISHVYFAKKLQMEIEA